MILIVMVICGGGVRAAQCQPRKGVREFDRLLTPSPLQN